MNDDVTKMITFRLDRIDDHIGKIASHSANVDVTLAKQSVLLEEHIRRTRLLEERVEQEAQDVTETMAPIKRHVEGLQFLMRAVGVVTSIAALVAGVLKLLSAT